MAADRASSRGGGCGGGEPTSDPPPPASERAAARQQEEGLGGRPGNDIGISPRSTGARKSLSAAVAATSTPTPFTIMCLRAATATLAVLLLAGPPLATCPAAGSHRPPHERALISSETRATTTRTSITTSLAAVGAAATAAARTTTTTATTTSSANTSKSLPHESNSSLMPPPPLAANLSDSRRESTVRVPKSAVAASGGGDDYASSDEAAPPPSPPDDSDTRRVESGAVPVRPPDLGVSSDAGELDEETFLRDELEFQRRLLDESQRESGPQHAHPNETRPQGNLLAAFLSHIDKQWKFAEIVLIIAISAILNLVTIVGNIMVLISFKMDRSLQTVSNYFLLSLALADLLIGLISMPLYTLYLLLNYWPLGPLMCDIWLAIDYLNSNAAVLNMLIISFDRYFSVTRPLTYRAKRTTKHAILMISFAWLLSLTIWTPAIFTYPYYKGRTVQGTDKCEIEFVKANSYLTFVTAILAFYIPVAIMIYLYWRIWLETKKRYRDLTTLFLVSGVGAAAPSRLSRPPQPPPPPLPSSTSMGAIQTHTGAAAAAATSGSQRMPTSKSSAPRISLEAGDRRKLNEPSTKQTEARAKARSRDGSPQPRKRQSDASAVTAGSGGQEGALELAPASNQSAKNLVLDEGSKKQKLDSESRAGQQVGHAKHQQQQQATTKRQPSCKLCAQEWPADQRHGSRGAARSKCCCCPTRETTTTSNMEARTRSGEQSTSKLAKDCAHCDLATACSYSCCPTCPAARQGSAATSNKSRAETRPQVDPDTSRAGAGGGGGTTPEVHNAPKCLASGSKSSLYHMIAEAAGSQHQRSKIHPEGSAAARGDSLEGDKQPVEVGVGAEVAKAETGARSIGMLVDVATSPIRFEETNSAENLSKSGQSLEVRPAASANTASVSSTSPISPEPEDCETRIVSHGDKFTFETNDPKLAAPTAATGAGGLPIDNQKEADDSQKGRCNHLQCSCKSLHSHLQASSQSRQRPPQSGGRHTPRQPKADQHQPLAEPGTGWQANNTTSTSSAHIHHNSRTGSKQSCCCADMMSVHDAECRTCRPNRIESHHLIHHCHRPSAYHLHGRAHHHHHHNLHHNHHHHHHHSHNYHHNHHHHHHQRHDKRHQPIEAGQRNQNLSGPHNHHQRNHCRKCTERDKSQTSTFENQKAELEQIGQNGAQQERLALGNQSADQNGSLPILDALQQSPQNAAHGGEQCKRPLKGGKKFSQKLTFSDILQERSNSCVTLEGEHPLGTKEGRMSRTESERVGGSKADRRPHVSENEQVIQSIVKRNADRLRTAFDDDLDERDYEANDKQSRRNKELGDSCETSRHLLLRKLVPVIFRSRNRPVRYRTDNYRGYRADDNNSHCEDRPPGTTWFRSICCLNRHLPLVTKHTSTSSSSSSSSRHNDERNSYQPNRPDHNSSSKGDHKNGTGGVCSQHSSTSSSKAQQCHHYHPIQPKSERKAAKTLSTLLLVFIVTWLPYNILVLIKTLSGGEDQVPEKIWNFSYYLCYINSTINPLCYALCNAQFRRTYMRILKCRLSNEHNTTRRMVPIQSSSTWNKDLRLNSTSGGDCSTNSTASHPQHHLQVGQTYNSQQIAKYAGKQRSKGPHGRENRHGPSSDSSAENLQTGHHHHFR